MSRYRSKSLIGSRSPTIASSSMPTSPLSTWKVDVTAIQKKFGCYLCWLGPLFFSFYAEYKRLKVIKIVIISQVSTLISWKMLALHMTSAVTMSKITITGSKTPSVTPSMTLPLRSPVWSIKHPHNHSTKTSFYFLQFPITHVMQIGWERKRTKQP